MPYKHVFFKMPFFTPKSDFFLRFCFPKFYFYFSYLGLWLCEINCCFCVGQERNLFFFFFSMYTDLPQHYWMNNLFFPTDLQRKFYHTQVYVIMSWFLSCLFCSISNFLFLSAVQCFNYYKFIVNLNMQRNKYPCLLWVSVSCLAIYFSYTI